MTLTKRAGEGGVQSARTACPRALPVSSTCRSTSETTEGLVLGVHPIEVDHLAIAARLKGAARRPARRRCLRSCRPRSFVRYATEDDGTSPRHVLAPVVSDALHHGQRAAVSHAEALTRDAPDIRLAPGCAVERHVADDDVRLRHERRLGRRRDDQPSARESLAEVVVRIALGCGGSSRGARTPRSSGPRNPVNSMLDGVVRESLPRRGGA